MAEIFRGQLTAHDGSEHLVAIKRLLPHYTTDEEFIVMLVDEARITAALDHPNIARIYEFGTIDEEYFLAMELIEGPDLRALIRRCRERDQRVPVSVASFIVEQALRGLHCAHEQRGQDGEKLQIIHRDFSPSNILVGYEGEVKLIDFGIAKDRLSRARTRGGIIKGKLKYMSPEQTSGRRLDRRSDVFAAGVVLYQAVTGQPPFHAPEDSALIDAIRGEQPDPPSRQVRDLDADFDALIFRALAKDPADRFDTAADFANALLEWLLVTDPDFQPAQVGRFIERVFARERRELEERRHEWDSEALPGEDTDTRERVAYTRFVDVGHFTGQSELDPEAELQAWLAARRGHTGTDHEIPTQEGEGYWSASSRPEWVDDTMRTLEMEALKLDTDGATQIDPELDESTDSYRST